MSGDESDATLLSPSNQATQGPQTVKAPSRLRSAARTTSQQGEESDGTGDSAGAGPSPLERQSSGSDLSELQRVRLELFESNKDLQELCRDNGLSASQFAKKGHAVATLDTFLGFWPSMKSVVHFPGLRELSIVRHPTIVQVEGLDCCPNLEQLTITECGLTRIENLDKCQKLKKLNLSSNKINSIEQLIGLEALEELWLSDNRIEKIEGLWVAKNLKLLWLCRNRIEQIDSSLNGCISLTELNMADNRISSFKSLLGLASLDRLSVLTLSDPHFGDNPVCRLCNYQTYLMCQFTQLAWLDTIELSARNKQIAEATMLKKKMYYNMRIKSIKRELEHRIRRANDVRRNAEQHSEVNISALTRHKKEIEQILVDVNCGEYLYGGSDVPAIKAKLEAIEGCLRQRLAVISKMNYDFECMQTRLQRAADVSISRLVLELETGGNIRLEDGNPAEAWYASCVELVKSRLFIADLRSFGVSDVEVKRVTRINNRYLRNRFHSRMEEILVVNDDQVKENVSKKGVTVAMKEEDDDGSGSSNTEMEKAAPPGSVPENSLEYLFYVQPPLLEHIRQADLEQFYASEYGFRDPDDYRKMGLEGAVKLSNSVSLLETSRLLAALSTKGVGIQKRELSVNTILKYSTLTLREQELELRNEFTHEMRDAIRLAEQGEWEVPGGVLLVVKVFPGYTRVESDSERIVSPIDAKDYAGLHSLQVKKTDQSHRLTSGDQSVPQKIYYMFDKTLVLPEYLVEYDYVASSTPQRGVDPILTKEKCHDLSPPNEPPSSSVEQHSGLGAVVVIADDFERRYRVRRPPSPPGNDIGDKDHPPPDLDESVVQLISSGPQLTSTIAHDSLLSHTRLNLVEAGKLKQLCLIGCEMDTMPDLSAMKDHIEVLVLAHNRLQQMNPSLRSLTKLSLLDISNNRLARIEYIDTLKQLADLDVSQNLIQSFDDASCASWHTMTSLRKLNLRKNPICLTKRYRLRVLREVKSSLDILDCQEVTQDELLKSERLLTRLSPRVLWSRYQSTKHVVLQGSSYPIPYDECTAASEVPMEGKQPCWTAVEELSLNRELVVNIEGFELFKNLRKLSVSDNLVRQIVGLDSCVRLEDLNLEDNEITKLENLASLSALKRLNLARNRLTSIDKLEGLENLIQLSLEENYITSLRGLGSALKLMELYVGNNRIENLKEVQHLKSLPKLTILDLSGNEITRLPDYRLYTVYYLRRVKVLDAVSVSPQDQSEAKQKYSGKLTLEFISEKCGTNNFDRLQELDLSSCRIRELGSLSGKTFPSLRDLNLENNQINEINGLEGLPKLRVLNLNRNRIERLLHCGYAGSVTDGADSRGILACTKLEQLFLAYNQINDMTTLGLNHITGLKVLHLQGNAIVFFSGLDANTDLLELRLDKNKIRQLDPQSTTTLQRLRVLSLDDNGLRSLSNFNELLSLEYLDLSNNRLGDLEEIEKLGTMPSIIELRLINNPLVKKHMYRHTVLFKLNTLRSLDGREVTAEERERVEVLFLHERAAALMNQSERVSNASTSLFTLAPSTVPAKHVVSASTASPMMIMTASRPFGSQLTSVDVVAGSLLRKNLAAPTGFGSNQQPAQSTNTFPKPDQPTDSSIAIAPGNTTTKSLLNSSPGAQVFRGQSITNHAAPSSQSTILHGSASPTVTVASALNASLSNTGSDQLNIGALRFDRRRINSVHYDPALNASYPQAGPVGMATGASSLVGGVITSNSILRAPLNVPSPHSVLIHPLSADMSAAAKTSSGDSTRTFPGYVTSMGNQKRYGSTHDRLSAAELATSLATAAKSGVCLAKTR